MKELKIKYNRIKSKFFIKNNESNDTKSIGSKSTSKTSLSLDNNNKIKLKKVKSLLPKILDKFDMFNYYKTGICDKDPTNRNNKKILIVFDKLNKIYFIQCLKNKNKPCVLDYDIKIYPKINIHNISAISEIKENINSKFDEYIIIFIGCLLNIIASNGKEGIEENNLCLGYLIAVDCLKKHYEIEKNNLSLQVEKDFFHYDKNKKEFEKLAEKLYKKKQENSFLLDCNSKNTDKISQYNPLLDKYLSQFFLSKKNIDFLRINGFIDEYGKIIYDPIYKESFGMSPKSLKTNKYDENNKEKPSYNSAGNSPKKNNDSIEINKFITGHDKKIPFYYNYKDRTKSKRLLPIIKKAIIKNYSTNLYDKISTNNKGNKINNYEQREIFSSKIRSIWSFSNKNK
jgi:hypothetical protein